MNKKKVRITKTKVNIKPLPRFYKQRTALVSKGLYPIWLQLNLNEGSIFEFKVTTVSQPVSVAPFPEASITSNTRCIVLLPIAMLI